MLIASQDQAQFILDTQPLQPSPSISAPEQREGKEEREEEDG